MILIIIINMILYIIILNQKIIVQILLLLLINSKQIVYFGTGIVIGSLYYEHRNIYYFGNCFPWEKVEGAAVIYGSWRWGDCVCLYVCILCMYDLRTG